MKFTRHVGGRVAAAFVCAVAAGTSLSAPAASAASIVVTVDAGSRFQTLEGWGTSLAWWANVLGGWSEARRTQIADLLFHPTNGLGLDIVRYNLGAGTNPDPNKNMRVGAEVPTFLPSAGNYDWSADANQRWMLDAAKARGTSTVEGFVNSPPAWMLSTACTAGAADGGNNLPPARYTDFANYIADVTQHFSTDWGTTFRTVSAFNEPSAAWWKCSNNQEGNHVDLTEQSTIVTAVESAMRTRGLPTGVSAAEEYSVEQSRASFQAYPKAAQDAASQINTHTYNATGSSKLRAVARENGKRLWTSEVGIGGSGGFNAQDLTSALQLAQRVQGDLTELRADAFVYWQAIEDDDGDNNYGFIKADFGGSENYVVTKQYSAMANYSRYIEPGSIVLSNAVCGNRFN
jgi:O-glycosyl hydrolase